MASEFLKSIQNYFDTVHNYKNFVGFKSRSNRSTAGVVAARYDSWAVNGDDPSGEGSPKLNADGTQELDSNGNSTGNDIKPANSFTQRWGDNESYQVGNNYTELEGDAVVVVVGNSSTRRKGWTNNVTDGLTFNTQIGGTVATSLFAVTTMLGFRCNTFVGADVNINVAAGVRVIGGANFTFGKATDWKTTAQENEATNQKTEIALAVKRVIGEEISTLTGFNQVVGGLCSFTSANTAINSSGLISLWSMAIAIDGDAAVSVSGLNTSIEGTTVLAMKSLGPATINGLIIKIG